MFKSSQAYHHHAKFQVTGRLRGPLVSIIDCSQFGVPIVPLEAPWRRMRLHPQCRAKAYSYCDGPILFRRENPSQFQRVDLVPHAL